MLLWIIFAALTAVVLAVVLLPLLRRPRASDTSSLGTTADIAVYRDQLAEIRSDEEQGLIGAAEAKAASTEISRRLLKRSEVNAGSDRAEKEPGNDSWARSMSVAAALGLPVRRLSLYLSSARTVLVGTVVGVPLLALSLYLFAGSPDVPAQPYADRVAATGPETDIHILIARAEAQLRENPKDGMGWDVLAPIYLRQRRYAQAAEAYARALDLLGETPKRLAGLARARLSENNSIVSEAVREIYLRLLVLQPGRSDAMFWLAKAKEQDGRLQLAAADYKALLASAGPDAPWRPMVEAQLRGVEERLGIASPQGRRTAVAEAPPGGTRERGPTAADIAAAQKMSVKERLQMIDQMVAGLAERLKGNGNDLPGWQKLVRAYAMQGKQDKAKQALEDARKQFSADGNALGALDQLAKRFNLGT